MHAGDTGGKELQHLMKLLDTALLAMDSVNAVIYDALCFA